ncbi:lactosylceramide 4-alpha-galactosyltransferase-like [Culicoides brevitarsis]|uniref:lactosylceramide 4-alpha-galactosyltransferase-like n=1 Tax=Culicoides brevitarsis TaxID=469753 RepID=UPI00307CB913
MSSEKLLGDGETFYKKIRFRYFIKRVIVPLICVYFLVSMISFDELVKNMFPKKSSMESNRPTSNMSIFFIESKRPKDHVLSLNARQACALESAALHNPDFTVIMYALNVTDLQEMHPYMRALRQYPNIKIIPTTMQELVKGSIAELWIAQGKIEASPMRRTHLSDFLRFFLLYQYGGIYLDTDFIVFKSLRDLTPGWAVAETGHWIGSAALGMDVKGESHIAAEYLIREFMETYNGTIYAYNGPGLLTRVAHKFCGTQNTKRMTREMCGNFEILEHDSFFPLAYKMKEPISDPKSMQDAMRAIKNSYGMHCWNGMYGSFKLEEGSAIKFLVKKHCPKIYKTVDYVFR